MALTGQAPFNKYQFRNILLNGQFTPQSVASGAAAVAEGHDTATGAGAAVSVKSSLNALGTGPQSRFTKFRASPRGISAKTAAGSAVVVESGDTVIAAGTGVVPVSVISSLNPRNLGPSPASPFNLNQFRAFQSNSTSNPALIGVAAVVESNDTVSAAGVVSITGSAAIAESADTVAGTGAPQGQGVGAISEGSDTVVAIGAAGAAGSASIAESTDTVTASGAPSTAGSAAISQAADTVNASGGTTAPGAAAITEPSDAVSAAGSTSTSGSAAITQPADVVAASGIAGSGAVATITEAADAVSASGSGANTGAGSATESSDIVAASGSGATSGSAAIAEVHDSVAGIGGQSGITVGTAAINESADSIAAAGSGSTSGSAAIAESADVSTGQAGALSPIAYPARVLRTGYMSPSLQALAGVLPYGEFFAAVGDIVLYGIDWSGWLANYWRRGANVPAGTTIQSRAPNGFQMTTVLGGESGNFEPIWPTMIGQTICEGSVLWTCEAIDTTSLSATVQSAAWKAPNGITIDGQQIAGQIVIASLDASQAIVGVDYQVNVPTIMSDGEIKTGRFVLKVR